MAKASTTARYFLRGSGFLALRKDDFLLAGYYRSGTTWVRLVLCNLISLNEWDGQDVYSVNDTMPELGENNLFKPWTHTTIPRVIKTHRPYSPLLGRVRSLGMIRDPRDVMVSRYHARRDRWGDFSGSFSDFIRHPHYGLEPWFRYYNSWRDHWILTVKYEDMQRDALPEYARIVGTLGVSYPDEMLNEAIVRSSFRGMQLAERQRRPGAPTETLHYRSGSSGQWPTYFGAEDLDHYRGLSVKYDVSVYP